MRNGQEILGHSGQSIVWRSSASDVPVIGVPEYPNDGPGPESPQNSTYTYVCRKSQKLFRNNSSQGIFLRTTVVDISEISGRSAFDGIITKWRLRSDRPMRTSPFVMDLNMETSKQKEKC